MCTCTTCCNLIWLMCAADGSIPNFWLSSLIFGSHFLSSVILACFTWFRTSHPCPRDRLLPSPQPITVLYAHSLIFCNNSFGSIPHAKSLLHCMAAMTSVNRYDLQLNIHMMSNCLMLNLHINLLKETRQSHHYCKQYTILSCAMHHNIIAACSMYFHDCKSSAQCLQFHWSKSSSEAPEMSYLIYNNSFCPHCINCWTFPEFQFRTTQSAIEPTPPEVPERHYSLAKKRDSMPEHAYLGLLANEVCLRYEWRM